MNTYIYTYIYVKSKMSREHLPIRLDFPAVLEDTGIAMVGTTSTMCSAPCGWEAYRFLTYMYIIKGIWIYIYIYMYMYVIFTYADDISTVYIRIYIYIYN